MSKTIQLGDCISTLKGFAFKSQWYEKDGHPIVKVSDFTDNSIDISKLVKIPNDVANNYKKYALKRNDIVIQTVGSWPNNPASVVGKTIKVPEQAQGALLNQNAVIIYPDEAIDQIYLYYVLKDQNFKDYIVGTAQGAASQASITLDAIKSFEHQLPKMEVQQKIASILSAYDDLIENNNRRIAILEEMARNLYREWFVKFRFPGHEAVKMVDSELGQIPEGWRILHVDEIVNFHIGGGWGQEKPDEKHSQPAYVIRGTDINHVTHGNSSVIPYRFHSVSNLKSRKLEIGDIVFEVSGGSKGQPVGRALLISKKLLNNLNEDVMCASFCKLIRCNDIVPSEYFYLHLKEIYDNGQIEKYQVQSTGITNFKFQVFLEQEKVLIPSEKILMKFLQPIQVFFDQINILGFKNLNLKTQRDMLLPKLISGKLSVI